MRWLDLVPMGIAQKQKRWERLMRVYRARHAGASFKEIGRGLYVSAEQARHLYSLGSCPIRSPVESYLEDQKDVEGLARLINYLAQDERTRGDWNEMCGLPRGYRPPDFD